MSKLKLIGLIMAVVLAGYGVGAAIDWLRLPGVELDDTPMLRGLRAGARPGQVTVAVFTDYQCPICRIDHPGIAKVAADEPDVRFVSKEWAILGPASQEAARLALAARYTGHYAAVRDALMQAPVPLTSARIRQAVGADWPRLQHVLAAHRPAIDAELARTSRQAFSLGLQGTPAYLVGNRLVVGRLTERNLRRLIRRAAGT